MKSLVIVSVAFTAYLLYLEYKRLWVNPDQNCLYPFTCPARVGEQEVGNSTIEERAARQKDTLRSDGRLELVSYPVPDPSMTVRDLYS